MGVEGFAQGADGGVLEVDSLLSPRPPGPSERGTAHRPGLLDNSVVRTAIKNLGLIGTWYALSTCITMYNKVLLGKKHGVFGNSGGFPAPLFMTATQFVVQWALSGFVLSLTCYPSAREKLSWREWAVQVVPNATSTGLDIGLSNRSLAFITVSFYTMCKSTVPLWLLCFAFAFRVERPSWGLFGVMVTISGGLLLLVAGETQFHLVGFLMVMSAALLSGFRWTVTQMLLQPKVDPSQPPQKDPEANTHDHDSTGASPVSVMYKLLPVMCLTVTIMSLTTEDIGNMFAHSIYFATPHNALISMTLVFLGACIAFFMVWAEFKVIQETSAVTFMVAGTFKEVVTVMFSVIIFGDEFHFINGMGLLVLLCGVGLFNYLKLQKLKAGKIRAKSVRPALSPDSQRSSSEGDMEILLSGSVDLGAVAMSPRLRD
eukprot:jgi/Tetstr1/429573/TSEL_019473.t1